MSKTFQDLPLDEQAELAQKVATCLKDNELGNVKVKIYREEVCQLTGTEVNGRTLLQVEKTLPSTQKAKADKFNEAVQAITQGVEGTSIKVSSVLSAGDQYQTIKNVTTLDDANTPVNIEHEAGTVVMIDFWATWCPPCQRPMQHNQDMLTEHAEKWGGKVKIIGLSIDGDAATVKNHITNKGWTAPTHFWRSKSDCSDVYQVKGVPHVLIIDTEGKIAFKGHPANRKDLAKDFDDLLAGKSLDGVEKGGEGDAEAAEESGTTVSLDVIKAHMAEMNNFKETGKELQTECKAQAGGMMRNFCVLTLEAELSPKTGNWTAEYTNHRVLVGAKDKIDHCKSKIHEKMGENANEKGWNFKINAQVQEM